MPKIQALLFCLLVLANNLVFAQSTGNVQYQHFYHTHKNPNYQINIHYPIINNDLYPNQPLNQLIKHKIQQRILSFKKATQHPVKNFDSKLNITAKITAIIQQQLISLQFTQFEYIAGNAHPTTTTFVVNYDLKQQQSLQLRNLFKANMHYLQIIAQHCQTKLINKLPQQNFINTGAAPKPENYRNWNITPNGLRIIFNPYQVAAYVYGKQSVTVPISVINPYLKRRYQKIL